MPTPKTSRSNSPELIRKRAIQSWILIDVGNSAFATTILAAVFPIYLPSILPKNGLVLNLGLFTWKLTAISVWSYTVSVAMLLTFVISTLLGGYADERGLRKSLYIAFTILGSLATLALACTTHWSQSLICFVLACIGYWASRIFYDSLLSVVAHEDERHRISLRGYAWGYLGGGVLLLLNLLWILKYQFFFLPSKAAAVKLTFASVGVWWLMFSLPSFFLIKSSSICFFRSSL